MALGLLGRLIERADWVNTSKRGEKNGVFQGLAWLLRGISRGQSPREIMRSSPPSQGSLFSLGERDTPPDNHKLAASLRRNEPPLVVTDLYRQSLYKSIACQTSSYARDQYNPFQKHH